MDTNSLKVLMVTNTKIVNWNMAAGSDITTYRVPDYSSPFLYTYLIWDFDNAGSVHIT